MHRNSFVDLDSFIEIKIRMKSIFAFIIALLSFTNMLGQYNVLILKTDDQSNQTVGAYGNPAMKTPNTDALASEGTRFTAAYNMGCWSPAVCIPSRTMFMYGKHLWDAQKINKKNAPKSLPENFHDNGYHTFMTGKWHAMGPRPKAIFDEVGGSPTKGQLKTFYSEQGHMTDVTAGHAVKFIENYNQAKPFFAYVAFNAPHVPRETEQHYYDMYPAKEMVLPPSFEDGMPLNKNVKYQYAPDPLRQKTMQKRVQQNNAMVSHIDVQVGNIISALKAKGVYENTIIVFTSDHGISFGENGVAGKVCLYEPSVTAPLIVKGPGIKANTKITSRVYLQDIVPTLYDRLNLKINTTTEFTSLNPLLDGKKKKLPSIYLAMFNDQRGIIYEDNKLIYYPDTKVLALYNLKKDPWETKNIAGKKASVPMIKNLLGELKMWQEKTNDATYLKDLYQKYSVN